MNTSPDYKKIYKDMVSKQYPDKIEMCFSILDKKKLDGLDIIKLNTIITENSDSKTVSENQKLRSYDKESILKILHHQKKHNMSNIDVSRQYKISRNTIGKWKKYFSNYSKSL